MEENKDKSMQDKLIENSEKVINELLENGIQGEELEALCKLTKIHKYAKQEKHWEKEENNMRYRAYGNYGNYNAGGNYGNNSYGRRGVDSKYRGHEHLDNMYMNYEAYNDGREEYNRGNYGAKQDTLMSLDYMLRSMVEFVNMLKQDATSQEEMNLIRQYTKQISEM